MSKCNHFSELCKKPSKVKVLVFIVFLHFKVMRYASQIFQRRTVTEVTDNGQNSVVCSLIPDSFNRWGLSANII